MHGESTNLMHLSSSIYISSYHLYFFCRIIHVVEYSNQAKQIYCELKNNENVTWMSCLIHGNRDTHLLEIIDIN